MEPQLRFIAAAPIASVPLVFDPMHLACAFAALVWSAAAIPLGLHTARTRDATEMVVVWSTADRVASSVVYRPSGLPGPWEHAEGHSVTFTKGDFNACNKNNNSRASTLYSDPGWIHRAVLKGLLSSTNYTYIVSGAAQEFWLESPPSPTEEAVHFDAFGDWYDVPPGWRTVEEVHDDVLRREVSLVLHVGDICYACGNLTIWRDFFDRIQPVASKVPWMPAIGNHEFDYRQQHWRPQWLQAGDDSGGECGIPYFSYFPMPHPSNAWYSFDHGPVHFALISTEHDFLEGSEQHTWLEQDLRSVDRTVTPWAIIGGHRPMYTSSSGIWGNLNGTMFREHFGGSIEPLLVQHRVDVALWGHVHNYERTCPVRNGMCGDPALPVHLVIGSGGMFLHPFDPQPYAFSVKKRKTFGYARFAASRTELRMEYVMQGPDGPEIYDTFVRQKGGSA